VAAYYALTHYGSRYDIDIVYCNTMADEHPDNRRFLEDVELWLGRTVNVISSLEYTSVEQVFAAKRYMSGIKGAVCTVAMKKIPRFHYQRPDDIHIFGYTSEEVKRMRSFENNNPELFLHWVLAENSVTKNDCLSVLKTAGIELPQMYTLGYKNNNCIGCVKATSARYWASVRKDFPEIFARRAQQSRELGVRLARYRGERIFLDELPMADYSHLVLEDISCGPECGVVSAD